MRDRNIIEKAKREEKVKINDTERQKKIWKGAREKFQATQDGNYRC